MRFVKQNKWIYLLVIWSVSARLSKINLLSIPSRKNIYEGPRTEKILRTFSLYGCKVALSVNNEYLFRVETRMELGDIVFLVAMKCTASSFSYIYFGHGRVTLTKEAISAMFAQNKLVRAKRILGFPFQLLFCPLSASFSEIPALTDIRHWGPIFVAEKK